MILSPVIEDELMKILQTMKNSHSEGPDGSSIYIIKKTMNRYVGTFAHIINSYFKNKIFPAIFKSARVTPLHKGSNRDIAPTTALAIFSLIFRNYRALHLQHSNELSSRV